MLKTQITGAKYLSPQTNQMTNLNIAVPADSKDTKFGTSDILLAKDVVAYLNALDSDISKELDAQTDKIDKINESIKQLIDHNLIKIVTELPTTDIDKNCIYLVPNKDGDGNNVFIEYIYVESKNTFEEVGRIQAKVDLSNYYTKEETDNQIQIAKNSAINIHNEDDTKSIKLDINDAEANEDYGSTVNASLIDAEQGYIANINPVYGFTNKNNDGRFSNLDSGGMTIGDNSHDNYISYDRVYINNNDIGGSIDITTNDDQSDGSPINMSLIDGIHKANINAVNGFTHTDVNEQVGKLMGGMLRMLDQDPNPTLETSVDCVGLEIYHQNDQIAKFKFHTDECEISLGTDEKFKISRPVDNTEGATITGVKSLTAFSNPSATKVWATDGSTVDLTTKANASDVLLKKSASGGYYIESNSNELGQGAFAANSECTASGEISYAEGGATASGAGSHAEGGATASGEVSHAEGQATASGAGSHAEGTSNAVGGGSHAEGNETKANGDFSHAEGNGTEASGNFSHAEGESTIASGGNSHAEGGLAKASGDNSHAEGIKTQASGTGAHAEGDSAWAIGSYSHSEGSGSIALGTDSHSEGYITQANGFGSHVEGVQTIASGYGSHAQGSNNIENKNAIHSVGIGNDTTRKNAEYIYVKNDESGTSQIDDTKNGYKYLIGVGGYDGISTDNSTYKSVQEVIADLTTRIEQLETKVRALEAANAPA